MEKSRNKTEGDRHSKDGALRLPTARLPHGQKRSVLARGATKAMGHSWRPAPIIGRNHCKCNERRFVAANFGEGVWEDLRFHERARTVRERFSHSRTTLAHPTRLQI